MSMISLDQFRAWLSGVEEMQDADWYPSKAQWDKIRSKIDLIESSLPTRMTNGQPRNSTQYQHSHAQPLMEPGSPFVAPMPSLLSDVAFASPKQVPPPVRFEPDVVAPPVEPSNHTSPKSDGNYRSGFV